MIDICPDIQSLTTFKRNSAQLIKRMRKTARPLVLTVRGKAKAVVLDPTSYQDVAGYLDTAVAIRKGLTQAQKGLGRSVDAVFDDLGRE